MIIQSKGNFKSINPNKIKFTIENKIRKKKGQKSIEKHFCD